MKEFLDLLRNDHHQFDQGKLEDYFGSEPFALVAKWLLEAFEANPKVHALIFWPGMERQISITGTVEKVPEEMSDEYFQSRPWGSKIGAWASQQSEELASRDELENRVKELAELFHVEVPRPPHWGGYVIKPIQIEFWQGRASRLHDRIVFELNDGNWRVFRKNP